MAHTDAWDPRSDIALDPPDKQRFSAELARTLRRTEAIRILLSQAGFAPAHIPFTDGANPSELWNMIFEELDNGAEGTYRALLEQASVRFPKNDLYRELTRRYISAPPEDDEPAEATPSSSLPASADDGHRISPRSAPLVSPASAALPASLRPAPGFRHVSRLADFLDRAPVALIDYLEGRIGTWEQLSPFQQQMLHVMRRALSERGVALVYAVTNSGKTTLARFGMNMALDAKGSAIMLLPTKALVAQESGEWDAWAELWKNADGPEIRVYPASRDYPENDRPVSGGRYDIAVAIYEKLGVYLVSGRRPLSKRTGVVVVDELQTLAEDSERAAKLEALLTLIKMLPKEDQPAILGLSATLTREATQAMQVWLGAPPEQVVETNERPVPLDTYIVDQVSWKTQPDAHLLSMPGRQPTSPSEQEHDLRELMLTYEPQLKGKIPSLSRTGELAAALVVKLLTEDADRSRRIICFVPSRTAARELSAAIQRVLKRKLGRTKKGPSPWEFGRFAGTASAERGRTQRLYENLAYSDLSERDEIIRGLKEGVAPHSAAYAARLRRLLEAEFREEDGLLRVLVATDTLAVGINLPADAVVATSISGYGGMERKRQILPPADLDNKGGRAGRRGQTARQRGEFYILVPTERELQALDGLTNQEVERLGQIDGVFATFVTAKDRSVRVRSKFRDLAAISGLVLQVLCQDGFARNEARWHERVEQILHGLLVAHEPGFVLPTSEQVLDELGRRKLIARRPRTGSDPTDKLGLSGLGAALGRSGLDLESAADLERLARLSCSGAGTIDLVWNACRSHSIQSVTDWLSLPPVAPRHYPSLTEAIITMALAYCGPRVEQRRDCAGLLQTKDHPLPASLVEQGDYVYSNELKALITAAPEDVPKGDVNALLRAVVVYEWAHGIPFADIRARISSAIRSDEVQPLERPVEVRVYYSDVEQFCEQLAGLMRSASELSFTDDGYDHSGQMRILAQEIEAGLPAWLAPVSKLRIPVLHRERLARLWDAAPPAHLADLLDREPLSSHPGISQDDRASAKHKIEQYEEDEREQRNRIAQAWADQDIPNSGGQTFEDLGDELDEAANSVAYLEILGEVVRNLGDASENLGDANNPRRLDVSDVQAANLFATAVWKTGGRSVSLKVPHAALSPEAVLAVTNEETIVVVRDVAPAAKLTLKRPTKARFIQPEHLLSLLASLVRRFSDGLTAREVVDSLAQIRVSSLDSDSWYGQSEAFGAPPPFAGAIPDLIPTLEVVNAPSDDELA